MLLDQARDACVLRRRTEADEAGPVQHPARGPAGRAQRRHHHR